MPADTSLFRSKRWQAGVWLIYLPFVFLEPHLERASSLIWIVSILSVLVFLPLYFAASDAAWRQERRAFWLDVAIALLGVSMVPFNIGGSTYVIYAAALAGFVLPRPRQALAYIAGLGGVLLAVVFLTRHPFEFWMLFQPIIVLIVGGGNVFAAEDRRRNAVVRRAQEEVEEMAKLAERERIARDLHDVLGHTLSVIALKSELASKLAEIDPPRAVQEIREVERVSREALSEVRAAVEGYRGQGLRGEVQRAAQALDAAGVSLDTDVAAVTLPPKQETALALAVREAITNVVRHAGAKTCRISLKDQDGKVVLRIEDDGVGGVPREGNGLTRMRERVAAIGGTLTLEAGRPFTGRRPGLCLTVTV